MTATANSIESRRLENGITLVFEPMPWLRTLSISFLFPLGSVNDPAGLEGSATVVHDWISRGAGELGSREFNDRLDGLGVRRGGGAGRETTSIGLSLLAQELPSALPLVADMLIRPRLEEEEFASARELALQELASLEDSPGQKLGELLTARFFTSAHGRSPYGSEEGLMALTPEALRSDHGRRFRPEGLIIAAAGGASWDALAAAVEEAFGAWQGSAVEIPPVETAAAGRHHLEADTSQVQIGLAYPAVDAGHPDWYLHTVAMNVLSGGMGTRLFTEVREKRGLVYSVGAGTRTLRGFGYVIARAGTTPERAEETLAVIGAEMARLREGITANELERSRMGLLSQLVMQGESSGARAAALAHDMHLRGKPRTLAEIKESVAGVRLEQVNDYLAGQNPPEPMVVTLGPAVPAAG